MSLIGLDNTHRKSQRSVEWSHPLCITTGKIVINGNHMHTLFRQCIKVGSQGCYQSFTFTGAHLGNSALMQGETADHLHIEMTHSHDATSGLSNHGKGFREQLIKGFALGQLLAQSAGFGF